MDEIKIMSLLIIIAVRSYAVTPAVGIRCFLVVAGEKGLLFLYQTHLLWLSYK